MSFVIKLNIHRFFFSNWCYLVCNPDTNEAVIIDASWRADRFEQVLSFFDIVPRAIFLTHTHWDHIGALRRLVKRYNAQVYMSREEIDFYRFRSKNLNALNDQDAVCISAMTVRSFLTPGHTKGGACFQIDANLFTGDTVFYEGCGLCHAFGGSALDLYHSIQFIKNYFPPETRVFPGHVYQKPPGGLLKDLRKENIYFNINDPAAFIAYRTRPGQKGLFCFR